MVSLFASFLTTGFTVAFAARDEDTSKYNRKAHPKLKGYVPSTNGKVQAFFSVVFFTTYTMAKMFALSLFIATSSSAIWTVGMLGLEFLGLLIWRMQWKNWRFPAKGLDGAVFGLLVHHILYIELVASPFPGIRTPHSLTPRIYVGGQLYRQQTWKQYLEQNMWEEQIWTKDHKHREWTGHEAVRAFIPGTIQFTTSRRKS